MDRRRVLGYVDAHANALLEHGFVTGEAIGVWLPESPEKHVTLMAAAKMGLQVVDFADISTVEDLRAILGSTSIKVLFFEPINETQDNLLYLRKAIPSSFTTMIVMGSSFIRNIFLV